MVKANDWNRDHFGNIFFKKNRIQARLNGVQRAMAIRPSSSLVELENNLLKELEIILNQEHELWALKSRVNWMVQGDRNTAFCLVELAKKIEILNSPIEIKEMKKDITILEITELSDNEKSDRHIKNIICHKCKEYRHTKKKCDKHNKNVKRISKLEFEKDIINELMEIFNA